MLYNNQSSFIIFIGRERLTSGRSPNFMPLNKGRIADNANLAVFKALYPNPDSNKNGQELDCTIQTWVNF